MCVALGQVNTANSERFRRYKAWDRATEKNQDTSATMTCMAMTVTIAITITVDTAARCHITDLWTGT